MDSEERGVVQRSERGLEQVTFSPVSPYQLLERVHADVVGVHGLDRDAALLQIAFINLIGMPCARREQQHDDQRGPIRVVWIECGRVCGGPYGFRVCARGQGG